jgi:pyridoxine/pyridoxamine 5'-phosphate oxidase
MTWAVPDAAQALTTDPAAVARGVIDANAFMTLATADADGRPWATPVWFAHRDHREFVWVSRPGARHSVNLAGRPQLAIAIFDSTQVPGDVAAVYVEAEGGVVTDAAELADGVEVFARRSEDQGLSVWTTDDVTGPAEHRLYRARARAMFILGPRDNRIEVPLDSGATA